MNSKIIIISIITPIYNSANFLASLIDTIKAQTHEYWECILVDDGSTDSSFQLAKAYAKEDSRIKVFQQVNKGPMAARALGFSKSTGQYIQFLDADDTLHPTKIEQCLAAINQTPEGVYTGFHFVESTTNTKFIEPWRRVQLQENPFLDLILNWEKDLIIPIHSFLFRRNIIENFFQNENPFQTHEDWDMHLNFASNNYRFTFINEPLAFYHIYPESNSRRNLTISKKDTLNVLAKYYSLTPTYRKPIRKRYYDYIAIFCAQKLKGQLFDWKILFSNKMPYIVRLIGILTSPYHIFKFVLTRKK